MVRNGNNLHGTPYVAFFSGALSPRPLMLGVLSTRTTYDRSGLQCRHLVPDLLTGLRNRVRRTMTTQYLLGAR